MALLTGVRVVYAVARDGLFLRAFAHTSRARVPDVALAVTGALAVAYVLSPLRHLADLFVVGAWPFYAVGSLATIVLRRKEPGLPRPHRTVGYPYTVLLFAAGSLAVVAGYALVHTAHSLVSLGVIALGVPVYAVARWARRGR